MKKVLIVVFAIAIAAFASGCGKYVGHAYGVSGKDYQAPDVCKAVAACVGAGEKECMYAHSDQFSCRDTVQPVQPKKPAN